MDRERTLDAVHRAVRETATRLDSAGLRAFAADLTAATGRATELRGPGGDALADPDAGRAGAAGEECGATPGGAMGDSGAGRAGAARERCGATRGGAAGAGGAGRAGGAGDRGGLPVLRHLPVAMGMARGPDVAGLAAVLDPLLPLLRWGQSAAYVAAPPNPGFLGGYAHAALLGPAAARPLADDPAARVMLGLLLLGPHVHYPPHAHPADEVYLPLTPAHWSTGADDAGTGAGTGGVRAPGGVLHHPPGRPHAMRTGATPLLAVYAWRGAIATPARLLRPGIVPL